MFSYSSLNPASKGALQREEQAKKLFIAAKKRFDDTILPTVTLTTATTSTSSSQHTIRSLLTPNIHLTSVTYGTFHKWVKENHVGWKLQRREATPEECKEHKAYNRGKSYWIDAVYQVPDPNKKKATKKKKKKKSDCDEDDDDDQKKPPAKKAKKVVQEPKNRIGLFPFWDQLDTELQKIVLSYSDVPTLGALVCVNKSLNQMAKADHCWENHLKILLQELYDNAYHRKPTDMPIIPISQRPLKSTEFYNWLNEQLSDRSYLHNRLPSVENLDLDIINDIEEWDEPDEYEWLFTDVSLREYYKKAGSTAYEGYHAHKKEQEELAEQTNRCPGCWCKIYIEGCRCDPRGEKDMFSNLPKIRLFLLWAFLHLL